MMAELTRLAGFLSGRIDLIGLTDRVVCRRIGLTDPIDLLDAFACLIARSAWSQSRQRFSLNTLVRLARLVAGSTSAG